MIAKPLLDAIVVEDGQSDIRFPDSTWADESDRCTVPSKANDLLNKLVTPETGPRWWEWGFRRCAGFKCKILSPLVVYVADLILV